MNWYKGNIAEAVAQSKIKNSIFVVYVEGKDEATAKLNKFINEPRIKDKLESDDFVAIKIESETETYMQFASIYQMVPVPSIFFIGKTGTPLDIATGVVASVEELESKIIKVLESSGKATSTASAATSMTNAFIKEESKATSSDAAVKETPKVPNEDKEDESSNEVVCKDSICFKKPKDSLQYEEKKNLEDTAGTSQSASNEEEAKLEETRKFLEQKRRERIEEEKRLEKESEIRRRKEGKDMQNLRAWQKDQEIKEVKESIKRDRLEEQAARERIRAQIAADRAERAHKFSPEAQEQATTSQSANAQSSNKATVTAADESRLQFRFASGTSNTQNFKNSTILSEVRDYVTRELLPGTGIKDFTLATTYPKRELTNEHNSKTLIELELFPSAVILIIGKEATGPSAIIARNGGLINMFATLIMTVLNPIFGILKWTKNWITGQRAPNKGDGGGNAQTGAQKRANEEQNVQNDVSKRRNLDRFLSGNSVAGTSSNSQDNADTSSGSSQGGAYRRYVGGSNIHRLSDNRKDSDDENATWNGNSTQQQ